MLGLRMFKGSENYSFEMDESCTCQVYQSCTLYISFPLASMHNFPSMQISTQWQRRARLARLPEHVPWHRKWIISTEQGTKQCNFVYGGLRISFIAGRYSQRSLQNTNSRSGWNQSRNPPLTSQALVFRWPRMRCLSVSLCKYYDLSDEN